MSLLNCGCCDSAHQYIAEHIDPSGTIEAGDDPTTTMARIKEMYKEMGPFAGPPITLDDVTSYIRGVRDERFKSMSPAQIWPPLPARPVVEMDWVCPECYANVRCDCA